MGSEALKSKPEQSPATQDGERDFCKTRSRILCRHDSGQKLIIIHFYSNEIGNPLLRFPLEEPDLSQQLYNRYRANISNEKL